MCIKSKDFCELMLLFNEITDDNDKTRNKEKKNENRAKNKMAFMKVKNVDIFSMENDGRRYWKDAGILAGER